MKDLEDAEGYVTTYGSSFHVDDAPASSDSVLVARLRAAGAIVVGKTNTPEFGYKGKTDNVPFGASKNPWNLERSPGGSSGGSAAAIAAGMIPLATGSDGGGSIRIPAAVCGLPGFKSLPGQSAKRWLKAHWLWPADGKRPDDVSNGGRDSGDGVLPWRRKE